MCSVGADFAKDEGTLGWSIPFNTHHNHPFFGDELEWSVATITGWTAAGAGSTESPGKKLAESFQVGDLLLPAAEGR